MSIHRNSIMIQNYDEMKKNYLIYNYKNVLIIEYINILSQMLNI